MSHHTQPTVQLRFKPADLTSEVPGVCAMLCQHLSPCPPFPPKKPPFGNWGGGSICSGDWL